MKLSGKSVKRPRRSRAKALETTSLRVAVRKAQDRRAAKELELTIVYCVLLENANIEETLDWLRSNGSADVVAARLLRP